ncbi:hypothetical protein ES703_111654 [subsurface metagenome]
MMSPSIYLIIASCVLRGGLLGAFSAISSNSAAVTVLSTDVATTIFPSSSVKTGEGGGSKGLFGFTVGVFSTRRFMTVVS